MLNTFESDKLFSKSVPVDIKEGSSNQSRHCKLFLTVQWKETTNALQKQELLISLTDNDDPFFLYNCHLSEEDFQVVKSSQGLLVDFLAFPQKFIELIESCLSEENKSHPKVMLMFNVNDRIGNASASQLEIIETYQWKRINHVSLKLLSATESSVKQYIAVYFRNLKDENRQLQSRLSFVEQDLREKLAMCQGNLDKKSEELEMTRKELTVELSMKENKFARELQEEREHFLRKQREEESRNERERKEKERSLRKEIEQLETRVSCLDNLNKELTNQKREQDGTLRELRSRVDTLESETKRTKESLREAREQSKKLQSEVHEKSTHMCHQKMQIDELEQEVAHKKHQLSRLQEQFDHAHKQQKILEEELMDVKSQFHRSLKNCDQLEEDIGKANNVIEKLQREIQNVHKETKFKNVTITKQEMRLSEKDKINQMLQKELNDLKADVKKKSNELKIVNDSVSSLKEKIGVYEKDFKARDNVIKYLNRQLTDRCIIPQYTPPSKLTVSPTDEFKPMRVSSRGDGVGASIQQTLLSDLNKPKTPSDGEPSVQLPHSKLAQLHLTDSAYASSPSTHLPVDGSTTRDENSNPPPSFELDPDAMTAAFGATGRGVKHSTAKKPINTRTKSTLRKKV